MPTHRDLTELTLSASVLTLGSFDGLHLGHQALIDRVVELARTEGFPSVVVTFYPHPSVVLRGRSPSFYITLPDEKAKLLTARGIDHVVIQHFDEALSHTPASDFLDRLEASLHFRHLCIGEDFALGHEREGNRAFLRKEADRRGYTLHVVPPVLIGGEIVSSTRVREALRGGNVARAATYLGRPFSLRGDVVRGAGRGRQLGVPTANLAIDHEQAYPGKGVYACWARLSDGSHPAVTNVGVRPTFGESLPRPIIETHVIDWEGDLYGGAIELAFVAHLRDERTFANPGELVRQIQTDIVRARDLLGTATEEADGG
jgi:riboflavin kinase/FMN adenylyltransferase